MDKTIKLGTKDICVQCGEEIEFEGRFWRHTGPQPRHIAEPIGNLVSIENFKIKEFLALVIKNPFRLDHWDKLINKKIRIDNKVCIIKGVERKGLIKKYKKDDNMVVLVESNDYEFWT